MGLREFFDGDWAWPEGLVHYVRHHAVRLPEEFLERARNARGSERRQPVCDNPWEGLGAGIRPSFGYWIDWASRQPRAVRDKLDRRIRRRERRNAMLEPLKLKPLRFWWRTKKLEWKTGRSLEKCAWFDCRRRALTGLAFCAHCLESLRTR
jgi:hypothetical protein